MRKKKLFCETLSLAGRPHDAGAFRDHKEGSEVLTFHMALDGLCLNNLLRRAGMYFSHPHPAL